MGCRRGQVVVRCTRRCCHRDALHARLVASRGRRRVLREAGGRSGRGWGRTHGGRRASAATRGRTRGGTWHGGCRKPTHGEGLQGRAAFPTYDFGDTAPPPMRMGLAASVAWTLVRMSCAFSSGVATPRMVRPSANAGAGSPGVHCPGAGAAATQRNARHGTARRGVGASRAEATPVTLTTSAYAPPATPRASEASLDCAPRRHTKQGGRWRVVGSVFGQAQKRVDVSLCRVRALPARCAGSRGGRW